MKKQGTYKQKLPKNNRRLFILGGVGNVKKKLIHFILRYYNSLGLILISFWLGATLITVDHLILGGLFIFVTLLKFVGLLAHNVKMRIIGLICLNALWAVSVTMLISYGHPSVNLPIAFPLYVLFNGAGIGIRGRFDE